MGTRLKSLALDLVLAQPGSDDQVYHACPFMLTQMVHFEKLFCLHLFLDRSIDRLLGECSALCVR